MKNFTKRYALPGLFLALLTVTAWQCGADEYLKRIGQLIVTGDASVAGNLTVTGTTTQTGAQTFNSATPFVFEGVTADAYETSLAITDPTADRTVTVPDAAGAVILSTGVAGAAYSVAGQNNGFNYEGTTADAYESAITITDPTADRTIIFPNASGVLLMSTQLPTELNSITGVNNGFEYEGATADAYETTITVTDPTADRTITYPNASGSPVLSVGVADIAHAISGGNSLFLFEGGTADGFETTVIVTDPTADNTILFPDASGIPILSAGLPSGADGIWGAASSLIAEGATADDFELTLAVPDVGADFTVTLPSYTGTLLATGRTAQTFVHRSGAKVGGTAGFVVAAADNTNLITCPASQNAAKLVVPVSGLKVGDIITGYHLIGQIESAGNVVTVDCSLFKLTAAAGDFTDADIGAMTQISVTADTEISTANSTKTLASPETIAANEAFYFLITATTNGATDIALGGVATIVTEN